MFSFEALCKYQTTSHSWFWLSKQLIDCLDKADKELVYVEGCWLDDCRVWYPASKYYQQLTPEQFHIQVQQALEEGDFEKIKQLKERIKECELSKKDN